MKIKIGYLEYDLIFVERMPEGHDSNSGFIDYTKQEIVIKDDGNRTDDYLNYVIYHEIAHGMLYQMGEDNTEFNADRLAHIIYQTFGSFKDLSINSDYESRNDLLLQIKSKDDKIEELMEALKSKKETSTPFDTEFRSYQNEHEYIGDDIKKVGIYPKLKGETVEILKSIYETDQIQRDVLIKKMEEYESKIKSLKNTILDVSEYIKRIDGGCVTLSNGTKLDVGSVVELNDGQLSFVIRRNGGNEISLSGTDEKIDEASFSLVF